MPVHTLLDQRAVLTVTGEDRQQFLQGLISNDVTRVSADRSIYAALLTPQGKFLHEMIVSMVGDALWLDTERARRGDLLRRLGMYKLRAKVGLADAGDGLAVAAVFGAGAAESFGLPAAAGAAISAGNGVALVDPRHAGLGVRVILPAAEIGPMLAGLGIPPAADGDYERLRLACGVPDGSRDIEVERGVLLEHGFEALNGVDFNKGCYIGQELTARTKYRGLVKRRLARVSLNGPAPAPGTPIMLGEREAGELRTSFDGAGLALLRLDKLDEVTTSGAALLAGDTRITPAD